MDKFDQAIIELLAENSRRSFASIGDTIGLSRTAVNDRIQRLRQSGVIQRYTIDIASEKETAQVSVYFQLTFRPFDAKLIAPHLQSIPEIKQAHTLSGDTDLIVYVQADSMQRINRVRERLAELPELDKIQTFTVLDKLV